MSFRPELFRWLWRPLIWLTSLAAIMFLLIVLVSSEPWRYSSTSWVPYLVFIHVLGLNWILGQPRSERFAYLCGQGFTRDVLWCHYLLVYTVSVLVVWVPVATVIWSPLRSQYQDWCQNPWFPLMADTEWPLPLWMLLQYFVFISLTQYEWIRSGVPLRGISHGGLLTLVSAAVWITLLSMRDEWRSPSLIPWFLAAGFGCLSLWALLEGQRLHRQLEIPA